MRRDDARRLQRLRDRAHDGKARHAARVEIAALVVVQLALARHAVEHRRGEGQFGQRLGDLGGKYIVHQVIGIGIVEAAARGDRRLEGLGDFAGGWAQGLGHGRVSFSIGAEGGEIEVDQRLLLDPLVGVLAPYGNDLADDFRVEAVALGLGVDFLDILAERLFLLVEPLDALDEGAQLPRIDFVRPGFRRSPVLGHVGSRM